MTTLSRQLLEKMSSTLDEGTVQLIELSMGDKLDDLDYLLRHAIYYEREFSNSPTATGDISEQTLPPKRRSQVFPTGP